MRYLTPFLEKDLNKKMVFLGGPRQCGKTTLAKSLMSAGKGRYFNWDRDLDRRAVLDENWSDEDRLLIFDELHKFPRWKNWVKGIYDTQKEDHQILVTGSARLDVYRRGGDSLLGRYHYWRLHPFSLSEIPEKISVKDAFDRIMAVGGFPEPFLDGSEREARRWRRDRHDRILKDDVRDLEAIREIQTMSLLVDLLRARVGGPVVISNLAGDLQVSPTTVSKWIGVLERMYLLFVVHPYSKNIARAVQKPPKIYFFDNADVEGDEGARFENLVATHLLKRIHFLADRDGHQYDLRYIRDKEKREVDFVILKDGKIEALIEAKWADRQISSSLVYYSERLQPQQAIQIVGNLSEGFSKAKLKVQPALVSPLLRALDE
jgi:predicted AAA+ superfamily ATPase